MELPCPPKLDFYLIPVPNYDVLENFMRCAYRQEEVCAWDLIFKLIQDPRLDNKICGYGIECLTYHKINYSSQEFIEFATSYVTTNFDFSEECQNNINPCSSHHLSCGLSSSDSNRYLNLSRIVEYLVKNNPKHLKTIAEQSNINSNLVKLVGRELIA